MSVHEELVKAFDTYIKESEKVEKKGVKSARTKARKALLELSKLCKERRKELLPPDEEAEE